MRTLQECHITVPEMQQWLRRGTHLGHVTVFSLLFLPFGVLGCTERYL